MVHTSDVRHTRFWILQRVLAIIATAPWVYLLWSGYDLCFRKGAASPNRQQLSLYVYGPAAGLAVATIFVVIARRVPAAIAWVVCVILFVAFFWLFGMWGGGI
jgi:hypothetical protein